MYRSVFRLCHKSLTLRAGEILTVQTGGVISNNLVTEIGRQSHSANKISQDKSQSKSDVEKLLDDAISNEPLHEDVDDNWSTTPYPQGALSKRDQSRYAPKPVKDPREMSIILFPGQGAQFVGMGKDLLKFPIARDLFEGANEILGYDLMKLCFNGPKEVLDKTVHCQPAVVVTSLAALERLKEERPAAIDNCAATAGFSVGEITSLIFSGAISFERGMKLVKIRAEAMQAASDLSDGGMMTVFYGPDSKLNYACLRAKEWCVDRGIESPECVIANYMFPHCKVVSGHKEALKFLEANASEFKLKRLKRLPVSGAFHSELMRPAVAPFKKALRNANLEDPIISVHSNVDGKRYRHADHILTQLPKQIVKPVRWEQTLHVMYERAVGVDFPRTFECGPGRSLKTVLKMVNAKAWNSCFSIEA